MDKQKKLLAVLGGILILAVGYAIWDYPRSQERLAPPLAPREEARRSSRLPVAASGAGDYSIRFDWLSFEGEFRGVEQNLFGPLDGEPEFRSTAPFSGGAALPPVAEGSPSPQELSKQLKYLGYLQVDGKKRFFVTVGDVVFVARKGEPFGAMRELTILRADDKAVHVQRRGEKALEEVPLAESSPFPAPSGTPYGGSPMPAPVSSETGWEMAPQEELPLLDLEQDKVPTGPAEGGGAPGGEASGTLKAPGGDWITEEKR